MSVNNVRFQWTSLSKPSTTRVTGKGFLACVDYHVSFEYWRFFEEFAAKLTSVPLGIRRIVNLQSKKKVLGIFGFVLTIFLLDSKCCTLSFTPWTLKIFLKNNIFQFKGSCGSNGGGGNLGSAGSAGSAGTDGGLCSCCRFCAWACNCCICSKNCCCWATSECFIAIWYFILAFSWNLCEQTLHS